MYVLFYMSLYRMYVPVSNLDLFCSFFITSYVTEDKQFINRKSCVFRVLLCLDSKRGFLSFISASSFSSARESALHYNIAVCLLFLERKFLYYLSSQSAAFPFKFLVKWFYFFRWNKSKPSCLFMKVCFYWYGANRHIYVYMTLYFFGLLHILFSI